MPLPTTIPTDFTAHWTGTISAGQMTDEKSTYPLTVTGVTRGIGRVGESAEFGDSKYATAASYIVPSTGDWAISTFIHIDGFNGADTARIIWQNNGGAGRWGVYIDTDGTPFFWSATHGSLYATKPLTTGQMHHLVVSRAGGAIVFYVDGVAAGSPSLSSGFSLEQYAFNLGHDATSQYFDGGFNQTRFYPRALTSDEVVALAAEQATLPASGAVQGYDFADLAAGSVPDTVGSNNATVTGSPNKIGMPGGVGLSFDGTTTYAQAAAGSSFSAGLTISAHVTFYDTGSSTNIVSKRDGVSADDFQLYRTSGGNLTALLWGTTSITAAVAWTPTIGQPYHIAVTYDGTNARLYVDGVELLAHGTTGTLSNTASDIRIGHDWNAGGADVDIAQVRIYDTAQTAQQVALLATSRPRTSTANLLSHHTMDNISGSTLVEELGNHDGTIVGAVAATGQVGNGLDFDGVDDGVYAALSADHKTQTLGVSLWVKPTTLAVGTIYSALPAGSINDARGLAITTDATGAIKLRYGITSDGNWYYATATSTLSAGVLTHIVATSDGTTARLYVDGVEEATADMSAVTIQWADKVGSWYPSPASWYIGSDHNASAPGQAPDRDNFDGLVDEVRFYTRGLEPLDILELKYEPYVVLDPLELQPGVVGVPVGVPSADIDIPDNIILQPDVVAVPVVLVGPMLRTGVDVTDAEHPDVVCKFLMDDADVTGSDLLDHSGNATGTMTDVGSAAGVLKEARSFNGTTSSVAVTGVTIPTEGSFSAYVNFNTVDSAERAIFESSSGTFRLTRRRDTGSGEDRITASIHNGSWNYQKSTAVPTAGAWHHVVFNYGATGNNEIWFDGVLVGSFSPLAPSAGQTFTIGRYSSVSMDGKQDLFSMFNRKLTPAEVATLFDERPYLGLAPSAAVSVPITAPSAEFTDTLTITSRYHPNVHVKYLMEDADVSGSTLTDHAGNADGTLTNVTSTTGLTGQAREFPGTSAQILCPTTIPLSGAVSLFVKWDTIDSTTRPLWSTQGGWINLARKDEAGTQKIVATIYDDNASQFEYMYSTFEPTADTWYHVVFNFGATGDNELWINGVLQDTTAAIPVSSSVPTNVYIGQDGNAWHDGPIDNFYIYDRKLVYGEILELRNEDPNSPPVYLPSVLSVPVTTPAASTYDRERVTAYQALTASMVVRQAQDLDSRLLVSGTHEVSARFGVAATTAVSYDIASRVTAFTEIMYDITNRSRVTQAAEVAAPLRVSASTQISYKISSAVTAYAEINYDMLSKVSQAYDVHSDLFLRDRVVNSYSISVPLVDYTVNASSSYASVAIEVDPLTMSGIHPGAAINPDGSTNPFYYTVSQSGVNIQMTEGEAVWTCSVELTSRRDFLLARPSAKVRITVGADIYYFLVDGLSVGRVGGSAEITAVLSGVTDTAEYENPRHTGLTKTWKTATLASDIVNEVLAGSTVTWGIVDWILPANRVALEGGSPIDLAQSLVEAAGGVLEPDISGGFNVRYLFPVRVADFADNVDKVLGTISDIFTVDQTYSLGEYYDKYRISETDTEYADVIEFIEDENADTQGVLRVYPSPWSESVTVTHTSSASVILGQGVVKTQEHTEIVEIVESAGSVAYPIHTLGTVTWLRKSLTGIAYTQGSSDIQTTHATDGYSLVEITYTTRYLEYSVSSPVEKNIQFLVNRPEE